MTSKWNIILVTSSVILLLSCSMVNSSHTHFLVDLVYPDSNSIRSEDLNLQNDFFFVYAYNISMDDFINSTRDTVKYSRPLFLYQTKMVYTLLPPDYTDYEIIGMSQSFYDSARASGSLPENALMGRDTYHVILDHFPTAYDNQHHILLFNPDKKLIKSWTNTVLTQAEIEDELSVASIEYSNQVENKQPIQSLVEKFLTENLGFIFIFLVVIVMVIVFRIKNKTEESQNIRTPKRIEESMTTKERKKFVEYRLSGKSYEEIDD